jgi:hypothetical protein
MKNFIITLLVSLGTSTTIYSQEIIKTNSINQIEIKSVPFNFVDKLSPIIDSALIKMICRSLTKAEMLAMPQPLYIFKIGKAQYKINGVKIINKEILSTLNPNNIEKIDIFKDSQSTPLYGEEGKNGVIFFTIKENKETFVYAKTLKKFKVKNPPEIN